ncbi:hypothetical protein P0Y43_16645 [Pseudomonas entomophila]|uniref:hypothetical protein n=1 Tax=Pseudomonas entomophila TaxID=312306 RepID=UPI0023D7C4E1|nr:hypothetical protein [Pseudomonas entomophila]MDF0732341.1 hypothetical protein [Pseudomonas entomophila]
MEAVLLTASQINDYRTGMQRNAAEFIAHHHQEHLDDEALRQRTALHLVETWEVPQFMAGRLAELAMSELGSPPAASRPPF